VRSEQHWNDSVAHLRQALAQDAFTLYCQPLGSLAETMTYPMAEVLVRLQEEEKALRPPGEFLPVLEHYGMMPELDRWVLRHTLRRLAAGCRIPRLCVNLSAQTLSDRAFPAFFAEELSVLDVMGDCLVFEIEEADALLAPDCLARFAATVGSLGASVAIEGFGRSEDAWDVLKAPCVRFVKLHGSVTRRLLAGEPLAEYTRALLDVASGLGIELVADCVDELRALRRLKAANIRLVQGFGVYAPLALDSFVNPQMLRVA
jgi:EAL domain-containing protein (putative c-di-GMP-specific phosphodiesterase class I)